MTSQLIPVTLAVEGSIAVIQIDNPPVNALSQAVRQGLVECITAANAGSSAEAIVIACSGKTFVAGADISEFGKPPLEPHLPDVLNAIERSAKPVIAALHGTVLGGGFELALACDFLYAAEGARFADTHARVGLLPGWGLSQKLGRLIGINRAREASLTGNFINAETAMTWGLVNKVCSPETLIEETLAAAQQIAESNPQTISAMRSLMNDGDLLPLGEALELEGARGIAYLEEADFSQMGNRLEALKNRSKKG